MIISAALCKYTIVLKYLQIVLGIDDTLLLMNRLSFHTSRVSAVSSYFNLRSTKPFCDLFLCFLKHKRSSFHILIFVLSSFAISPTNFKVSLFFYISFRLVLTCSTNLKYIIQWRSLHNLGCLLSLNSRGYFQFLPYWMSLYVFASVELPISLSFIMKPGS